MNKNVKTCLYMSVYRKRLEAVGSKAEAFQNDILASKLCDDGLARARSSCGACTCCTAREEVARLGSIVLGKEAQG